MESDSHPAIYSDKPLQQGPMAKRLATMAGVAIAVLTLTLPLLAVAYNSMNSPTRRPRPLYPHSIYPHPRLNPTQDLKLEP